MDWGCAVKISNEEILTIAGNLEPSRKMLKYNVGTGDAVEYNNAPPTQVEREELQRNNCHFFSHTNPSVFSDHCCMHEGRLF